MDYGNIVWGSRSAAKLKKLASKQKQALRVVNNEYTVIREIMIRNNVLNIYKLNIYQILNIMFKIKKKYNSMYFRKPIHGDSAPIFNQNSFTENQLVYSQTKSFITSSKALEQTIRPTTKISEPRNLL